MGIFEENIQFLADRFFRVYEDGLKIQMGLPKNINMLQSRGQVPQGRNHPMRFSFEKLITAQKNEKKMKGMMNALV